MQSQRILSADDITQLIGAAFRYNNMEAVGVDYDIRNGLRAIVTVEEKPLELADVPQQTARDSIMDSASQAVLDRMRQTR